VPLKALLPKAAGLSLQDQRSMRIIYFPHISYFVNIFFAFIQYEKYRNKGRGISGKKKRHYEGRPIS
jgi:hypothetical protein